MPEQNNKIIEGNDRVFDELLDSDILNATEEEQNNFGVPSLGHSSFQQNQFLQHHRLPINESFQKLLAGVSIYREEGVASKGLNHQRSMNQQNSTSTIMTGFNSAIFDDASIFKLIEENHAHNKSALSKGYENNSILEDNLNEKEASRLHHLSRDTSGMSKQKAREAMIKAQTTETQMILQEIVNRIRGGRQRSTPSQEELEVVCKQASNRVATLGNLGLVAIQENEILGNKLKYLSKNLKAKLHSRLEKYKEVCRRQWKGADSRVFKYQVNEFDQNQRILQLEERLERQQEEINKQANFLEQVRYQKLSVIGVYEQRMKDIEVSLKGIIKKVIAADDDGRHT